MPYDADSNRVTLRSDGIPVLYAESYEIQQGILQQPAAFAIRLGADVPTHELADMWPPNTPFTLSINDAPQFTGRTDGFTMSTSESGGSVTLRGRDALAPLHDGYATSERSFASATFEQLVNAALTEVHGLSGAPTLIYSNEANRKAIVGVPVKQTAKPKIDGVEPDVWVTKPAQGKQIQIKMGQRWLSDFLKPELDRAGLFLWAAGDGTLILSTPNTSQEPTYSIHRRRAGYSAGYITNIISSEWRNEPTARFSRCDVHCRSAGGDKARVKSFGTYDDAEVISWGINRPLCIKDDTAKTIQQAEFLARRRIAEARRAGWALTYTVAGHTAPSLFNGAPAVWAPDTIVAVEDDQLGLFGSLYLESVEHRVQPHATTTLHLMRIEDVIFGEAP